MIEVECIRCKKFLDKPGALVMSPPMWRIWVYKLHLCTMCWEELTKWLGVWKDE